MEVILPHLLLFGLMSLQPVVDAPWPNIADRRRCIPTVGPCEPIGQSDVSSGVLEKIDAYRVPYEAFLIRTRITAYKKSRVTEEAVFDAYIQGNEKSLVIQKAGKNRDMKLLYVDEMLWVHLPASRRPIRITPIQRLMGQASNGDVAMVSYGDDYTAERIGEERVLNRDCLKLKLNAHRPSATYHQIILHVDARDYRPVRAEFYLVSGKHFKTAVYDTYFDVEGHDVLRQMTITDVLRPDEWTVFEYEHIEEKSIEPRNFNKNYLIHVRGL